MNPTASLITTLLGQLVSFGLGAFLLQYVQKKLDKIDDIDKRVTRLETRDEMRK